MAKVEIDEQELEILRKKADRWDHFRRNQTKHLNNNLTAEERSERARKAVQARWAKKNSGE